MGGVKNLSKLFLVIKNHGNFGFGIVTDILRNGAIRLLQNLFQFIPSISTLITSKPNDKMRSPVMI